MFEFRPTHEVYKRYMLSRCLWRLDMPLLTYLAHQSQKAYCLKQ